MKIAIALTAGLFISGSLFAQQANVQWRCHTLAASGNYVAPDEQIMNGMACKAVNPTGSSAPAVAANVSSQADSSVAPAQEAVSPAAQGADDAPAAPVS